VPLLSAATAVAAAAAIALGLWGATLAEDLDELRDRSSADRRAIAVFSDPEGVTVPLEGANGRLVVSRTGSAALVLSGVGEAPAGKTYEIWVIEDGNPRPAGLFRDARERTVLPLSRPVPEDAVVAVTLEPAGGVDLPTGSPLFATPARA
jgi:anti-sigma-K factor RskA